MSDKREACAPARLAAADQGARRLAARHRRRGCGCRRRCSEHQSAAPEPSGGCISAASLVRGWRRRCGLGAAAACAAGTRHAALRGAAPLPRGEHRALSWGRPALWSCLLCKPAAAAWGQASGKLPASRRRSRAPGTDEAPDGRHQHSASSISISISSAETAAQQVGPQSSGGPLHHPACSFASRSSVFASSSPLRAPLSARALVVHTAPSKRRS